MPEIIDQDQWGICGFVSVLNGLRTAGLLTKMTEDGEREMNLKELQTRLYAEIVTYLKYISFTRSPIVDQIEEITNHLRPVGQPARSVLEVVQFIERRLREIAGQEWLTESGIRRQMRDLITNDDVTISMTPDAVVDYMKWAGVKKARDRKVKTTQNTGKNLLAYKNCVIGMGEKPWTLYNGLEHWVYVDANGVLNNWGEKRKLRKEDIGTDLLGPWAIYITHVIKMG